MLTPEQARRVSLIEVLMEEAEAQRPGQVAAPPEEAALSWSEDQIRQYFKEQLVPRRPLQGAQRPTGLSLPAAAPPAACNPEQLARWFPGLKMSGTSTPRPRMRVLAFHSAGNAEDMWTSEGTGPRRSPSPLLEWCRGTGVELLAVQMPGRGTRAKEPFITTAQDAARALLPVMVSLLSSNVPYAVVSHSYGTWVCFELLRALRREGLPLPRAWCLSAMPYPDLPYEKRPWRQQRTLSDADFKEEMRGWDVNEVVFTPDMWQLYEPILRADCTVFDEYELRPDTSYEDAVRDEEYGHDGSAVDGEGGPQPTCAASSSAAAAAASSSSAAALALPPPPVQPFDFPIGAFWGNQDRRVKRDLVAPWARYTRGGFRLSEVAGNHLWPINNRAAKASWLTEVVGELEGAAAAAAAAAP